jgi:predicted RNA-binding Zn ribbon-like protein
VSTPKAPPIFIAGLSGLDFLNSLATPVNEPVEWLGSGDELLGWLEQAGLLPSDVAKAIHESVLPGELDAVAAQARALREWFRGFVRAHKGKRLAARALSELEPLNRILARDEQFAAIQAPARGGFGLRLVAHRRWRSPEALLFPIASAIADVICREDFRNIKGCEGHNCVLFFVDRTRRRRWCSMAICGNRAKQAAHRRRSRR